MEGRAGPPLGAGHRAHIVWANGHCTDRPEVVLAGLLNELEGIVEVETYEHTYDSGTPLPEGLRRAANEYEYENNVMT